MKIYNGISRVIKVEQKTELKHISGAGKDAVMESISLGWFVTLDNFFSIGIGNEKPDIEVGDVVVHSIRKKHNITLTNQSNKPEKKITFAPTEKPQ